jgi:hypothetical protein
MHNQSQQSSRLRGPDTRQIFKRNNHFSTVRGAGNTTTNNSIDNRLNTNQGIRKQGDISIKDFSIDQQMSSTSGNFRPA